VSAPTTCTARRCTASAYARGLCRCSTGRDARRRQVKLRQAGLSGPQWIDATGTRRRVEGLLAMGWTGAHIAEAAGIRSYAKPSQIAYNRTWVRPRTARAVLQAVAKLGGTDGPSVRARSHALGLGYVPLWAWDEGAIDDPSAGPMSQDVEFVDEVAIERAVRAVRLGLPAPAINKGERAVVIARLAAAPVYMTDSRISDELHLGLLTVRRIREAAGVPQASHERQKRAA
jgi:hypothetical protein